MDRSARLDKWRVIGPGGGGTMMRPTISPHDPAVALVHCDMTGSYITLDGGRSWRMMNIATGMAGFAFDPTDADVIYGYNVALWRSEDRGATWRLVWPDPASDVLEHRLGDHANYGLSCTDASYPSMDCHITAVGVDPEDGRRVWLVCTGRGRPQRLMASEDRGGTWEAVAELGRCGVHCLHVHRGVVRVATTYGVHEVRGGRHTLRSVPDGATITAADIGVSESTGEPLVYALTTASGADLRPWRRAGERLLLSADGGADWQDCTDELILALAVDARVGLPVLRTVGCCGGAAETAYLSCSLPFADGRPGPAARCGIAKTTGAAATWEIVWEEAGKPAPNMQTSHLEPHMPGGFPNVYYVNPLGLGVAPSSPAVCLATDIFRAYRTDDGGATWWSCHSRRVEPDTWTTTGLDVTTNYGVHFDPFDPKHLFITYTDIGLYASRDGGRSWASAVAGIPRRWENTTYWIEFDPKVRGLVWGAFALHHDLPRPKMWRGADTSRYEGGVAVSTDGGASWTVCSEGMPQTACTHILLDPTSPVGRRTLYVCGFGRGVYKSTDNGRSWQLKNNGIAAAEPFAWRLTRAADGTLYLVLARRSELGEFGGDGDGALYRSTDGAETWQKMALPEGCNGPVGLTLDPADSRRMYLSAWGRPQLGTAEDGFEYSNPEGRSVGEDVGGGVFLSEDGGASWRCIFDRDQHVYDVTVDPADPRVLYLCGFDSAAYRSTDGGASWSPLRGYNFKWGHRVILDPQDRTKVYITTYGGSVWHGAAVGDLDAIGDVVTPLRRA